MNGICIEGLWYTYLTFTMSGYVEDFRAKGDLHSRSHRWLQLEHLSGSIQVRRYHLSLTIVERYPSNFDSPIPLLHHLDLRSPYIDPLSLDQHLYSRRDRGGPTIVLRDVEGSVSIM